MFDICENNIISSLLNLVVLVLNRSHVKYLLWYFIEHLVSAYWEVTIVSGSFQLKLLGNFYFPCHYISDVKKEINGQIGHVSWPKRETHNDLQSHLGVRDYSIWPTW